MWLITEGVVQNVTWWWSKQCERNQQVKWAEVNDTYVNLFSHHNWVQNYLRNHLWTLLSMQVWVFPESIQWSRASTLSCGLPSQGLGTRKLGLSGKEKASWARCSFKMCPGLSQCEEASPPHYPTIMRRCLIIGQSKEPSTHGLKLLKPWDRINALEKIFWSQGWKAN